MIEILFESLKEIWVNFIGFLPVLIAALIVFIVGWVIAIFLGKLVNKLIKSIKLDSLLSKLVFETALAKAKLNLNSARFFEELVKWFFIVVFLMAAANILGIDDVVLFLKGVLYYVKDVIIAAIILLVAAVVAKFVQKLVKAGADTAGLALAGTIAGIAKWAIVIFGFVVALTKLGIPVTLIQTIVMGIVAILAIAGGLAFGLGGKDMAARILEKLREDLSEK